VCAANSREWLLTFWAVAGLNAVLVAMNGWWTGPEMRNALELTDPTVVVMDEKRHARLDREPTAPLLLVERDFAGLADDTNAVLPDPPIAEDDPFILIFTSGTTGRPKAAVLSHRSVISYLMEQSFIGARGVAMAGMTSAPAGAPLVRLAPYPLFHVSGMSMAVSTVMSGSTSVWPLGRFDPGAVIELTKQENVAVWGGGTTHVVRLLQHPDVATIPQGQINSVGIGGSATPPDVVRQIEERFPNLTDAVSSGYGSTETALIMGSGVDAQSRAGLRRPAHACRGRPHHRRRRHRAPVRLRRQHRSPQLDVDARVLAQRRRRRRDHPARAVDPHRRLRPPRRRHPVHRVPQARPDHPRRREHLPVRDRAPARRTTRRR
jgi:acyl-CoA synthetase (AMP-forming)/AMP-acid ligase II